MAGTSAGRFIAADDGNEYAVKGPVLAPDQPYVAVNELVCAVLAGELSLPQLACAIVEWNGDLLYGSRRMLPGTWRPRVSTGHIKQASNRDVLYGLAVFDAWLLNRDRTPTNLLIRTQSRGSGSRIVTIYVWDHSQCPIAPRLAPSGMPTDPAELSGYVEAPVSQFVQLAFIRDEITKSQQLADAAASVEMLNDDHLAAMLELIPDPVFPDPKDRDRIAEFLAARRDRLRSLFEAERRIFRLDGGVL